MRKRILPKYATSLFVVLAVLLVVLAARTRAQAPAPPTTVKTPHSIAPIDLTGYWVSVVTEDWRYRMIVPDKGDYQSVPLNPEGTKIADTWDPARDQAEGNQCKSYGAPALLRIPGRLHITWENDNTLHIDTDSGTQTRLLHFGGMAPAGQAPTWQGYSVASWEGLGPQGQPAEGYLKAMTSHLRAGYVRKNGVPYSANASLEEYFDSFKEVNGDIWLVVTTIVTDSQYFLEPFVTSTHFKKLPNAAGWDPTPCRTNEPR